MNLTVGQFIVWLVVGGLAGTLAGMLVTFKKEGLGRWTNLGVGMVGALIGGLLFRIFKINLGLGELKVTFNDLISAFFGSLLFVVVWWLVAKFRGKKAQVGQADRNCERRGKQTMPAVLIIRNARRQSSHECPSPTLPHRRSPRG